MKQRLLRVGDRVRMNDEAFVVASPANRAQAVSSAGVLVVARVEVMNPDSPKSEWYQDVEVEGPLSVYGYTDDCFDLVKEL